MIYLDYSVIEHLTNIKRTTIKEKMSKNFDIAV